MVHPSWYLGLNERELRKDQLIKSALGLHKTVKKIGAKMVVENMHGAIAKRYAAVGSRLKSILVADGDGLAERHYFPCSGKGKNDWNAIFSALYKAGYDGAFIYECAFPSLESMKPCYETMYTNFLASIKEK